MNTEFQANLGTKWDPVSKSQNGGWSDDSVVKSTGLSSREPRLGFQQPIQVAHNLT